MPKEEEQEQVPVYKVWAIAKEQSVKTLVIDGNEFYPLFPDKKNAELTYSKLPKEFIDEGYFVKELDMVLGKMTRVEDKDKKKDV